MCGDLYSSSDLEFTVTILVQDPNNPTQLVNWVDPTVPITFPNPLTKQKTDLVSNPNTAIGSQKNCLPIHFPGQKPFAVKVEAISNCCQSCPACTNVDPVTNVIYVSYGKQLWIGEKKDVTFGSFPDTEFIVPVDIFKDINNPCVPNLDCK